MDTVTLVLAGVVSAVVVAVVLAGRLRRECLEHDAPLVDEFFLEIELMCLVDDLNFDHAFEMEKRARA